ncbi:MAG: hypothetical protein IKK01_10065 [Clostridia bacterium]|nr:hypothetical protein [Clostridia bacterium]
MQKKHPRLAFWLTVIPAALGSALAVYHLFEVARTIANPEYTEMLGGFSGGVYLLFDYFSMSLTICLLLFTALLLNLLWSHALSKLWGYSVLAACAVFLICGMWIIIDSSGALAVSLNLAVRTIAESVTAIMLVHSLTQKTAVALSANDNPPLAE